jgi:hypothetical protein
MKMRPVAAVALLGVAAACAATSTPSTVSPSQAVHQASACGRLTQQRCAEVIAVVEAQIPGTKQSNTAVADWASPAGSSAAGGPSYLVAFAPWASGDLWLSPPTWRVSGSAGTWSVEPWRDDVRAMPVCFIEVLREANLTDYAPKYPSGVCQP